MADWTTIPNSNLEPDAPARSIDALALRDNPIAIAEGAAGAPKVARAAFGQTANQFVGGASAIQLIYNPRRTTFSAYANATAAGDAAGAGDVPHFVTANILNGGSQSQRATWYYPALDRVTEGGEQRYVAAAYNPYSFSIVASISILVGRYTDDVAQVRLLRDGSPVQTISVPTGAGPNYLITFNNQTVLSGSYALFSVQGQIGAGSGADALLMLAAFASVV